MSEALGDVSEAKLDTITSSMEYIDAWLTPRLTYNAATKTCVTRIYECVHYSPWKHSFGLERRGSAASHVVPRPHHGSAISRADASSFSVYW